MSTSATVAIPPRSLLRPPPRRPPAAAAGVPRPAPCGAAGPAQRLVARETAAAEDEGAEEIGDATATTRAPGPAVAPAASCPAVAADRPVADQEAIGDVGR